MEVQNLENSQSTQKNLLPAQPAPKICEKSSETDQVRDFRWVPIIEILAWFLPVSKTGDISVSVFMEDLPQAKKFVTSFIHFPFYPVAFLVAPD